MSTQLLDTFGTELGHDENSKLELSDRDLDGVVGGTDVPATWGGWIADVERPASEYRGRYQLRLDEARKLVSPK